MLGFNNPTPNGSQPQPIEPPNIMRHILLTVAVGSSCGREILIKIKIPRSRDILENKN